MSNELEQIDQSYLSDPVKFKELCWPDVKLYDKQVDILYSLKYNDETYVPAGNKLGKDFISGFAVIWFFCSRSPARVVTTSANQTQLKSVLWGEMRRFIQTSSIPLPITVNDMLIRQNLPNGDFEPLSYILGLVSNVPEAMLGHHLARTPDEEYGNEGKPRTLWIADEASSVEDPYYEAADTWSHRKLIIGNPLPCTNFFFRNTESGSLKKSHNDTFYRKVIRIRGKESPNVRLAETEISMGKKPSRVNIIPGALSYDEYEKRRLLWDPIRQTIGLDAEFYKGSEALMFPPDWLNLAEEKYLSLRNTPRTSVRAMGVDPGEGHAETSWTIIDHYGIIAKIDEKTPDTSKIISMTIQFMKEYHVIPENVNFDRGGGGKQHADALRALNFNVMSTGFGESVKNTVNERPLNPDEKTDVLEQRTLYKNRRAQMYGMLRDMLKPSMNGDQIQSSFGISSHWVELRRQLAPLPMLYDGEGKVYLPPKSKPNPTYKGTTLMDILGCSPDQADSLVLAVYKLQNIFQPLIPGRSLIGKYKRGSTNARLTEPVKSLPYHE